MWLLLVGHKNKNFRYGCVDIKNNALSHERVFLHYVKTVECWAQSGKHKMLKKKIRNIFSIVYVLRRLYKKAKAKAD